MLLDASASPTAPLPPKGISLFDSHKLLMATSDGIDKCLLHRGRSQSDPNILSESGIDLSHGAGKMMHLLSGDAIRKKAKRFSLPRWKWLHNLRFHFNIARRAMEINQITSHLMHPVEMHLENNTIVIFPPADLCFGCYNEQEERA